jgi:hypothetical protein
MTDETCTTKSGKILTDPDIEQLADEAATIDYDIEALKPRAGGSAVGLPGGGHVDRRLARNLVGSCTPSRRRSGRGAY